MLKAADMSIPSQLKIQDCEKNFIIHINHSDLLYAKVIENFLQHHHEKISCMVAFPEYPKNRKFTLRTLLKELRYLGTSLVLVGVMNLLREAIAHYQRKNKSLKKISASFGIPFFVKDDVNGLEVMELIKQHHIQYVLNLSSQLYQSNTLNQGVDFYNFHAGLLPDNKGRFPLFWSLLREQNLHGATCHKITDKIDAGEILFQKILATQKEVETHGWGVFHLSKKYQQIIPEMLITAIHLITEGKTLPAVTSSRPFYGKYPTLRNIMQYFYLSYRRKFYGAKAF